MVGQKQIYQDLFKSPSVTLPLSKLTKVYSHLPLWPQRLEAEESPGRKELDKASQLKAELTEAELTAQL